MSEDNKRTSQFNNSKRKSHKKHRTVLPYFSTPIIYVLISLIAIVPVCFVLMNVAVATVHSAQKTLTPDFCDITASSEYNPSAKTSGATEIPKLSAAKKIGKIICDDAGLNADVYYGLNRVSLRNGAGLNTKAALPGQGKAVQIFGYSSTSFKALKNVDKGDTVSFETEWGTYAYSVTDVSALNSAPTVSDNEIVLASDSGEAFSYQNGKMLYVTARLVSGPSVKEVP